MSQVKGLDGGRGNAPGGVCPVTRQDLPRQAGAAVKVMATPFMQ